MIENRYGVFFGRPPFAPFRRAAAVFAALVTLPPLRPNSTAAGFLRGTEHIEGFDPGDGGRVEAVSLQHRGDDSAPQIRQLAGLVQGQVDRLFGGVADVMGQSHRQNIANRLGYVK